MTLARSVRFRVVLRSFVLQAAWNFDKLQNLGWAFCVLPALKALYPDRERRLAALKRHTELFNTHPYMAGYILGAALKAEDELARGAGDEEQVASIKARLSPALAAVGDSFFWAILRPASGLVAVAWLWLAPHPWHLGAPLVFLAVYNVPGLWMRLHSVEEGWAKGEGVALHVASLGLPATAEGMRRAALVGVAAVAGAVARLAQPVTGLRPPLADNFLFLGAGLVLLLLLRLSIRPVVLLVLCALSALAVALAFPD